jgi:periplasmic protein TonB
MLHQLLESGAPTPRRGGWAFASGMVHVAIIAAAAALTVRDPAVQRVVDIVDLVYLAPPTAAPRAVERSSGLPTLRAPATLTLDVPRIEFPSVTPVGIPEPSTRLSDAIGDIAGNGVTGPVAPGRPDGHAIYSDRMVDRAVMPRRDNPTPGYPAAMRAAGVDGTVLVQFVVDTMGRVEPGSISILRATHEQFGDAVRRWLGRTRYLPGEIAGHRVRQLVQQEVGFSLQR